ncbi:hypothetical protein [Endozoicomonas numazuensis]|uniref:Uncharacterized protein n=1 Tax=Endozoicomonas numazuensis TaxID=1137799 RepID=A0A081NJY3_9GAMM|nr:hypothetical protein [Endozoicomonas numazuensis]KEQ18756.1 hypothetical protein GZ78_01280 [Endozoicomonas numazuensis]
MHTLARWLLAATVLCCAYVSAEPLSPLYPQTRTTCLGTQYSVRPAWDGIIEKLVISLREQIQQGRQNNKRIVYISLPLGAHNGGVRVFNEFLGTAMKQVLLNRHPQSKLEIILPGQIETELLPVDGEPPNGGEYLYMWTQVLMGEDCQGAIDWIYYMDHRDVASLLKLSPDNPRRDLSNHLDKLASDSPSVYGSIARNKEDREAFLNYYLHHYSPYNSKGMRDEWNMVQWISGCYSDKPRIRQHINGRWTRDSQPLLFCGYQLLESHCKPHLQAVPADYDQHELSY